MKTKQQFSRLAHPMARIIITYNQAESDYVPKLAKALRIYEHKVWFERDFSGGAEWWQKTCKRVAASDIILFLLSPGSAQDNYCQSIITESRRWETPVIVVITDQSTPIPAIAQQMAAVALSRKLPRQGLEKLNETINQQVALHPSRHIMPLWKEPTPAPALQARKRSAGRSSSVDPMLYAGIVGAAIFFLALFAIVSIIQRGTDTALDIASNPQEQTEIPTSTMTVPATPVSHTSVPATSTLIPATSTVDVSVSATPTVIASPSESLSNGAISLIPTLPPTSDNATPVPTATRSPDDISPIFELIGDENDAQYLPPEAVNQAMGTDTPETDETGTPGEGSRILSNSSTVRIVLQDEAVVVLQPHSELALDSITSPGELVFTLWSGEIFVNTGNRPQAIVILPVHNIESRVSQGSMSTSNSSTFMLQCFYGNCQAEFRGTAAQRDVAEGERLILFNVVESELESAWVLPLTQTQISDYNSTCGECISSMTLGDAPIAIVTGNSSVNLRGGPGTSFARVFVAAPGEQLIIQARTSDSSWLLVTMPSGETAWIAEFLVDVEGDLDSVAVRNS